MDNILTYARWLRRIKQVSNIDTFRKTIQQFSLLDLKAILSCNDFSSTTFLKKKNDRSFRPFHNFILLGSQMERSNTRWFTNNFQIIHDQSWWYFNAFLEEVSRRKIFWTKKVCLQAIKYRNIDGHVARLTHYSHFVDTFRLRKSDINIAGCKAPFKGRMACNRVHVRWLSLSPLHRWLANYIKDVEYITMPRRSTPPVSILSRLEFFSIYVKKL